MRKSLFYALMMAVASCFPSGSFAQSNGDNYYEAFISIENNSTLINRLESSGVQVNAQYEGFLVARINQTVSVSTLAAIDGVKHVTLARNLVTCSDSARYYSRVDAVQQGQGFEMPYTGKGVIVGVIDCGFDFNHINLCDNNGISRVRAVYMPLDNSGTAPVVNGYTLPGTCYEGTAAIKVLTTDDASTTHGTQTAGIAAGSYRDNGWYGMAPDADIVACGMPEGELNDVRVANCIAYIADYAKRAGKPCVINISLGSNEGPHDGTSFLTKVFEQVSGPGRVIVVSAGNDGDDPVCFHRTIDSPNDTVTALLTGYSHTQSYSGTVSAWTKNRTPLKSRIVVVDVHDGNVVYASEKTSSSSGQPVEISSSTDEDFRMFYSGKVSMKTTLEANDRYSTNCDLKLRGTSTDYTVGIQYFAESPTEITVWTTQYAFFDNYGFSWVEKGTSAGSISDLATTDSVISVGSYNTKQYVPLRDNTYYHRFNSRPEVISYFSAYGPDENGIQRPDVCAPGSVIIASANRYDVKAPNLAYWQPSVYVDGIEYPYCPDLGTSMSAPVVAGAIALWMQNNPELSTQDVREILFHSSYTDSHVEAQGSQRWGSGKLDVAAGLRYMMWGELKKGDINLDGSVNISDISVLVGILLYGTIDNEIFKRADVNGDGDVNISDLNVIIDIILRN